MSVIQRLNMEWAIILRRRWFNRLSRGCEKIMYHLLLRMSEIHHEATRTQRFTKSIYMNILNFVRLRAIVPLWQNCMADIFDHEFPHNLSRVNRGVLNKERCHCREHTPRLTQSAMRLCLHFSPLKRGLIAAGQIFTITYHH